MARRRLGFSGILLNVVLWIGGLVVAIPFLWMIFGAFKTQSQIFGAPLNLWPTRWQFSNFGTLFSQFAFGRWYLNSVVLAIILTAVTLAFSSLGGYGFAKYQFRGKGWLFAIVLISLSIPFQSILIPLYGEMSQMHLVNTYASLVVPFMAPPIGIFLMRQFMYSIPDELLDAARIDGCGELILYARIILPLLKPALGALSIITFIGVWGNFLWPLVMLNNTSEFTLPLGLYSLLGDASNGGNAQYGMMFAGATLASVPPVVLFMVMQRAFISGLTMGGVKD